MPNPKRILPIVIVLLVLGGGYYLWSNGLLPGMTRPVNDRNVVSGFIEVTNTRLRPNWQDASAP